MGHPLVAGHQVRPNPLLLAADLLDPQPDPWAADPAGWVRTNTGEHPWSAQVRIMESVVAHRRTAVPAAHGPGKSWTAARIVAWWIDTHPVGEAFVVTTAPTWDQVKNILWRELGRVHIRGHLAGTVLQNAQWKIGAELVAIGRKPADYDEDAFQGIHSPAVLVIIDEAGGIDKALWTGALTLLTNAEARILAPGNPDHPDSEFKRICEGADEDEGGMSAAGWNVIPISVFATPAFTGELVATDAERALTTRLWAREFAGDMGGPALVEAHDALAVQVEAGWPVSIALERIEERHLEAITGSPPYVAKVLARFPTDAADGVVPWSWLRACQHITLIPDGAHDLGIDVGGSDTHDSTVIYERTGAVVGRRWTIRSSDPTKVLDACVEVIAEVQPDAVKIDSIGIGWGLMAGLRLRCPTTPIHGVNVAEAAAEPHRFVNKRAEIWWEIARNLSKDRAWDLTEATESTLAELAAPRWREDKAGRIVIESKDDIRKRLKRSTDNADAVILAFYEASVPRMLGSL